MAEQSSIKIRTALEDGVCTLRALIRHPMETGGRKDEATGERIPAHHITELTCEHNGEPVMTCHWGTGIAKNPYLSFRFRDARAGDTVTLRWTDNRGESDAIHAAIS
ncbi:MAG: thiosulfate oxidation carrier complex protein SoxZ [Chromatiales bacterium]